jgi:hypothetical protein
MNHVKTVTHDDVEAAYLALVRARTLLEINSRFGIDVAWPDDVPRPDGVLALPTEACCQLIAARLRDMLDPEAPRADGVWPAEATRWNADQAVEEASRRATQKVTDLADAHVRGSIRRLGFR